MKRRVKKKRGLMLGVLMLLFLTGCANKTAPAQESNDTFQESYSNLYRLSEMDLNTDSEGANEIKFTDGETVCLIEKPGTYRLTGEQQGQIRIDVQDGIVHLILDNASLQSYNGPAIYVQSAAKTVITIPEGSSSVVQDSAYYADYPKAKACIYSTGDLTLNGGGELQVYAYGKDAIRSKDTLKLLDLSVEILAKDTGLWGNDGVVVSTAFLEIQSEQKGIYTGKKNKEDKGFVVISSGEVNIISGKTGVDAAQNIYIHDCKVNIYGVLQPISCEGKQYIQEGCLE